MTWLTSLVDFAADITHALLTLTVEALNVDDDDVTDVRAEAEADRADVDDWTRETLAENARLFLHHHDMRTPDGFARGMRGWLSLEVDA